MTNTSTPINIILSLLLAASSVASANSPTPGFSTEINGGDNRNFSTWMEKVDDHKTINQLSLLGTHDTATWETGYMARTQSMDITRQLNAGVRAFDIRCQHKNNKCALRHGRVNLDMDLHELLTPITNFLRANSSETIFLILNNPDGDGSDGKPVGNTPPDRRFAETFKSEYWEKYADFFWKGRTIARNKNFPNGSLDIFPTAAGSDIKNLPPIPYFVEVRGKIVVFHDFSAFEHGWFGFPGPRYYELEKYSDYVVADTAYVVANPGARQEFWDAKKTTFENYSKSTSSAIHLTGINGIIPNASILLFPPSYFANHINQQANNYFRDQTPQSHNPFRAGVVFADFPDTQLIENISRLNFDRLYRFRAEFTDINDRIEVSVNGKDVHETGSKSSNLDLDIFLKQGANEVGIRLGNNDCFGTSLKLRLIRTHKQNNTEDVSYRDFKKRTSHCGRQFTWRYSINPVTGEWSQLE